MDFMILKKSWFYKKRGKHSSQYMNDYLKLTNFKKFKNVITFQLINNFLKIINKIIFFPCDLLCQKLNLYIVFLREERIGHQAGNADVEFYKANKRIKKKNSKTIFIFPFPENKIANKYLRYLLINYVNLNFHKAIFKKAEYLNNSLSKLIIYSLPRILKSCKNIYFANTDRGPRLSKSILYYKNQNNLIFDKLGIEKGKYICIYSRDDKYLKSLGNKRNWDYHRYRNSNIDNLRLLSEWIIENQKCNVVRIGSCPEKRISWSKGDYYKIIDYPFLGLRSEENDINLISNCNLYVSNGGGPEAVAIAARREMIKINQVPLGDDVGYIFGLWLPKMHIKNKSKKYLSLIEICDLNIEFAFNGNVFEQMEISLKENTSLEILNLFKDYIRFKTNKFSEEDKLLIYKYNKVREIISSKRGVLKCNKNFIAPSFLKKYKNLLEY